jgi:hypothetical protein
MINIFLYYYLDSKVMKSLDNRKKGLPVLTISLFITAAITLATPAIMSTNTYAQEEPACQQETAKVLKDTNAFGWNPDGNETRFIIEEPCYSDKSIVLVNTKDGDVEGPEFNTEVCNVDYSDVKLFEVYCNNAPFDGSDLRYVVSDHEFQVVGEQPETQVPTDSQRKQDPARAAQ